VILTGLLLLLLVPGYRKKRNILASLQLKHKRGIEYLRIFLLALGSLLLVLALLSPRKLLDEEEQEVKGMNIYALIDVSRSMLVEDVYPNRLEGAKRVLLKMLQNLKGDRIGFIPFSDSAYIQMPLTDDYSIGRNYIEAIDGNLITGGGTNIKEALSMAQRSFQEIGSLQKTVVILSDGGESQENALREAQTNKIRVYTVGIGTASGGLVPDYENGRKVGFIKDEKGSAANSRLDAAFLRRIAEETGGVYYEVNNLQDNFMQFFKDIENLDRIAVRDEKVKHYAYYFQIPLALGFLLVMAGFFLKGRAKDEK
jgi:Ca-activated chloride channel family protein